MPNTSRPIVLIVEDAVLVRMMLVDSFEEAGFKVYEAAHANEALRVLHARDDIMVVITDVEMPTGNMDGFAMAQHIREIHPGVGVLIASGRRVPADGDLSKGTHFMAEPFHSDTMLELVRPLSDSSGQATDQSA